YDVYIRKASEPLHQFEMPPGTEEIQLSGYHILFFLCGRSEQLKILQPDISLADTIPGVWPQSMIKFISRCRIRAGFIQPCTRLAQTSCLPGPEIPQVNLIRHVPASFEVEDFVVTPIP